LPRPVPTVLPQPVPEVLPAVPVQTTEVPAPQGQQSPVAVPVAAPTHVGDALFAAAIPVGATAAPAAGTPAAAPTVTVPAPSAAPRKF
jgi:hypothetical protein